MEVCQPPAALLDVQQRSLLLSIFRLAFACKMRSACATEVWSLRAGPMPNKTLIGAAMGSCIAVVLAVLALLYVWRRRRSAPAPCACFPGPKGRIKGAAGRQPASNASEQAAAFVLPPLAVRAGSLPLRVRLIGGAK